MRGDVGGINIVLLFTLRNMEARSELWGIRSCHFGADAHA